MSTFSLRALNDPNPAEIQLYKELRLQCGWDDDLVDHWFEQASKHIRVNLLCELQDPNQMESQVVGMIALVLQDDDDVQMADVSTKTAMIKSLFIKPEYQGRGYGKESIRLLEDFAVKQYGIETMTLETSASSKKNMAFYIKLGYAEFRERSPPLPWSKLGAAYMSKKLIPPTE
ncbi:acyl-CoA N-acyltransferase [Rhizoclosmatium globosum]|uniref:Acyl-CoA N-acyltransferase n=1 Tax=Rhizoclosmatium globosum TaxID=329046 RepID=A0A1Y2C2W6_9FUNG|nr:acyl-CoA N-acyltransferase [Rhizoclosmatium globosum]|eukprot:ORY41378.1 acyl-CoA N-acyltransferase [Rhizoclosmatium globosum]